MTAGNSKQTRHFYEFGPFRMDPVKRLLLADQVPVPLTPKAFDVLLVLVRHHGEVVEKNNLMRAVWPDTVVEENNLTRSISALRKALGENPDEHRYIVTVSGRGYSFVASVAESTDGIDQKPSVLEPAPAELEKESPRVQPAPAATGPFRRRLLAGAILLATVGVIAYLLGSRVGSRAKPAVPFQKISLTRLTNTGNSSRAAISPDGKYVAHVVGEAGQHSIRLRLAAAGSEVEIVPVAAATYGGLTFSHDSNHLYYGAQETNQPVTVLYRVPVLGGPPRKLRTGLDSPISLSPEGTRFAFVREYPDRGESVLLVANEDGTGERRVASRKLPEYFDYPAWSPDGKRIACTVVGVPRNVSVVEVRLDDGTEKFIGSQVWGYVRLLKWLHDGSGLVMTARDQLSSVFSIWHLSYPRGEARRITNNLDDLTGVSVTADSSALLTVEDKLLSSLWVTPHGREGRARQILSSASRYAHSAWTPDGRILYEKQAGGRNIWVTDADGSKQRQLTVEGGRDPSVCPDGRRVVYLAERAGVFDIWRMDIDGANPKQLAPGSEEASPQCSADGKWVIYTSVGAGKWRTLWKTSIEGDHTVQLNDKFAHRPAISPDGRWIACFYRDEQASQQNPAKPISVAIIPFEGGSPRKVFPIPQTVFEPAGIRWRPDGSAFTYVDNRDGISNIWRQPLAGGPSKQVTDFKGDRIFNFDWSADGKQLVLSRGSRAYNVVLIRDLR